jgi:hypothetical protein
MEDEVSDSGSQQVIRLYFNVNVRYSVQTSPRLNHLNLFSRPVVIQQACKSVVA